MLPPADVPIHRPSVGAMAVAQGSQMPARYVKPYIYRGTGEDQFPETDPNWRDPHAKPPPKSKPKPKPRKRRKPRRSAGQIIAEARRHTPAPRYYHRTYRPINNLPDISEWREPAPPPPPKRVRPAPGWQPTTGDDLDAMLDEIGDP